ncbi:MAG: hypothetical protein Q9219_006981 [cf. Caloplaca sp. 3 TL-2023]
MATTFSWEQYLSDDGMKDVVDDISEPSAVITAEETVEETVKETADVPASQPLDKDDSLLRGMLYDWLEAQKTLGPPKIQQTHGTDNGFVEQSLRNSPEPVTAGGLPAVSDNAATTSTINPNIPSPTPPQITSTVPLIPEPVTQQRQKASSTRSDARKPKRSLSPTPASAEPAPKRKSWREGHGKAGRRPGSAEKNYSTMPALSTAEKEKFGWPREKWVSHHLEGLQRILSHEMTRKGYEVVDLDWKPSLGGFFPGSFTQGVLMDRLGELWDTASMPTLKGPVRMTYEFPRPLNWFQWKFELKGYAS